MSGDVLILVAAFLGLVAKRLATPPRWLVRLPDVVEILVGSVCMLALWAIIPAGLFPASLTATSFRRGLTVFLLGFFLGPGIVTLAKAALYERLPGVVRGMLPPPTAGNRGNG